MPTCFVIMGFGEKPDFATGRKLDLDKSYRNIIKPAVVAAGYECIRADEVLHSGVIDVPMYNLLFSADLVVADLSTANANALFELGVRHALRPYSTIIIAESQFRNPFDINHIVIRSYVHLGVDIGYSETMRMQEELRQLALAIKDKKAVDSPVYTSLPALREPKLGQAPQPDPPQAKAAADDKGTYAALYEMALKAKNDGDFALAKTILLKIYEEQTKSTDGKAKAAPPRIVQELTLATYKSGEIALKAGGDPKVAEAAYNEAAKLLKQLGPDMTTDPETLGLWSAIHKRRADLPGRSDAEKIADLNIAVLAAERSFLIRSDYYTGTNLAFLLNVRASLSEGDDRITDNVLADRVRRKVVEISTARLKVLENQTPNQPVDEAATELAATLEQEKYWTRATLAESLVALGKDDGAAVLEKVLNNAPAKWMADVTKRQVDTLRSVLKKD